MTADTEFVFAPEIGDEDIDMVKTIQKGVRLQIKINQLKVFLSQGTIRKPSALI